MKRKLVSIGEGKVIDLGDLEKPQAPKSKPKPNRKLNKKTKRARRKQGMGTPNFADKPKGFQEWRNLRLAQVAKFYNKIGFRTSGGRTRFGIPDGMTARQATLAWAKARERAKIDMANLENAGLLPDDEIVKEATEATLVVMRSPMNQDMQLRAARQILDFYKTKPVTKSETTVNAAEAWLASLATDTPKE